MEYTLHRRHFLTSCGLGLAGLNGLCSSVRAIQPFERSGPSRMPLSLAAYSFRQFFPASSSRRIDLFEFIDYCAAQGLAGTELTSYYFPEAFDEGYLLKLRRHAFLRGIAISGTAIRNTFTHRPGPERDREIASVKKWIDHAAVMGAPHIRIFAGDAQAGIALEESKSLCVAAIDDCARHAAQKGIFLGLENHHGIVGEAKDLLDIVKAVDSPWFGINLDSGNFRTADPYADFAACAPYAVNVQLKVEIQRGDAPAEETDLARIVWILRDAHYQGYVALEYEASEDPWQAVPRWLTRMQEAFSG